MRHIDINDSKMVIAAVVMSDADCRTRSRSSTPGRLVLAATQIARAIRKRKHGSVFLSPALW